MTSSSRAAGRAASRLLLLLLSLACLASASQHPFVVRDDDRSEIAINRYGYAEGGYWEISLTDLQISGELAGDDDAGLLGLYLRRTSSKSMSVIEPTVFCFKSDPSAVEDDPSRPGRFWPLTPLNSTVYLNATVAADEEAFWTTSFINCRAGVSVSFSADWTVYNAGPVYLPVGEYPLPLVFGIVSIGYWLAFGVWLYLLVGKRYVCFCAFLCANAAF